jgi:hypothetical protein
VISRCRKFFNRSVVFSLKYFVFCFLKTIKCFVVSKVNHMLNVLRKVYFCF